MDEKEKHEIKKKIKIKGGRKGGGEEEEEVEGRAARGHQAHKKCREEERAFFLSSTVLYGVSEYHVQHIQTWVFSFLPVKPL